VPQPAGNIWQDMDISPLEKVFSIAFDKNGVGLTATYFDLVRTVNNGAAWESIPMPEFETMSHIIEHEGTFWALVKNSIYKTQDYGTTWEVQMTTASNVDIRFGSFASTENGDFGWAIGKYGFIASYKKTHTKVDRQPNTSSPNKFELSQNVPNPFNPTTEIRFSVSKQTHVSLEIYNLMGQKIATLMDAKKYPGRYAISWDGKNRNGCAVSSGVYFYRLQAGDFNATMKMLLIR